MRFAVVEEEKLGKQRKYAACRHVEKSAHATVMGMEVVQRKRFDEEEGRRDE